MWFCVKAMFLSPRPFNGLLVDCQLRDGGRFVGEPSVASYHLPVIVIHHQNTHWDVAVDSVASQL